MTTLVLTSELDAINTLLSVIGEAPVSSLEIPGFVDVALAKQMLNESSREIQAMEWECNTEEEYTLTPDNNGYIYVPENILKLDISDDYIYKYRPVQRAGKLYDKKNHTEIWSEPIKVNLVWLLDFADLPQHLRYYITINACRKFQKRYFSSGELDRFTQDDEIKARAECLAADAYVADYNMMDNYTVSRTLDR